MSMLEDVLPAAKVHARLEQALAEMQRAEQNAVLLFAEILRRKLYRDLGYSSIHAYACDALKFSESKTYQFLRLAQSLEKLPVLTETLAAGEISWTKARTLTRVATPDNERNWIEAARTSSRRELERKIDESRLQERSAQKQDAAQGSLLAALELDGSRPLAHGQAVPEADAVGSAQHCKAVPETDAIGSRPASPGDSGNSYRSQRDLAHDSAPESPHGRHAREDPQALVRRDAPGKPGGADPRCPGVLPAIRRERSASTGERPRGWQPPRISGRR